MTAFWKMWFFCFFVVGGAVLVAYRLAPVPPQQCVRQTKQAELAVKQTYMALELGDRCQEALTRCIARLPTTPNTQPPGNVEVSR